MRWRTGAVLAVGCVLLWSGARTRSVWDGVYTEEQAGRGKAHYNRECASCHGEALSGGEEAPPLAGDAFLANWNGLTVGDLFERIRRSMPQDNPGRLSRQQDIDILAYMLAANRFPAGKAELESRGEALKQIRFDAAKPRQAN
ncbi:MAG: cytochrome c [Acidobacteriia bacterium]|nr:cytochrome c [Terriglobia bacterium]